MRTRRSLRASPANDKQCRSEGHQHGDRPGAARHSSQCRVNGQHCDDQQPARQQPDDVPIDRPEPPARESGEEQERHGAGDGEEQQRPAELAQHRRTSRSGQHRRDKGDSGSRGPVVDATVSRLDGPPTHNKNDDPGHDKEEQGWHRRGRRLGKRLPWRGHRRIDVHHRFHRGGEQGLLCHPPARRAPARPRSAAGAATGRTRRRADTSPTPSPTPEARAEEQLSQQLSAPDPAAQAGRLRQPPRERERRQVQQVLRTTRRTPCCTPPHLEAPLRRAVGCPVTAVWWPTRPGGSKGGYAGERDSDA